MFGPTIAGAGTGQGFPSEVIYIHAFSLRLGSCVSEVLKRAAKTGHSRFPKMTACFLEMAAIGAWSLVHGASAHAYIDGFGDFLRLRKKD